MNGKQLLSWIREHSCFDFISEGPSSQRESHEEFHRRCAFITSERERRDIYTYLLSLSFTFLSHQERMREGQKNKLFASAKCFHMSALTVKTGNFISCKRNISPTVRYKSILNILNFLPLFITISHFGINISIYSLIYCSENSSDLVAPS